MFSLLKKIIGVLLFVFGCFDCVKSTIIGFVTTLTINHFFTLAVLTSQLMLLYTLFHCIPFRSFVFKALGDDPWELSFKSQLQQHQHTECYWSSSESDTVVYDPENLHWSSSSLSNYLDEVNQDGGQFPLPVTKPTRHAWVWTSDEDSQDESYDDGVSENDAGYMTDTTTESHSSCDENEESLESQQHLSKSSTDMMSMKDEAMAQVIDAIDDMTNQVDAKISESAVGSSTVQEVSANVMQGDEVNNIPESYEETISTDGILQSKAVKLGLLAAGVGIGAYIVYKLFFKK